MKTAAEVKPNYGPVYAAALYPQLAEIFVTHGYALAVHGSLARDFDLIGIPWVENPSRPEIIIAAIQARFAVTIIGQVGQKPHGRLAHNAFTWFWRMCGRSVIHATTVGTTRRCKRQPTAALISAVSGLLRCWLRLSLVLWRSKRRR